MPFITGKTICETFLERTRATPDDTGFLYKADASWKELTFKQFYKECKLLSFGLMGLGVSKGDKVALLSNTRIEWSICDMAILGAGGVTVPIYAANTAEDVQYILNDSDAKVLILEDRKQIQKILQLRSRDEKAFPKLEKIVALDPQAIALSPPEETRDALTLAALREIGRREDPRSPGRFDDNLRDMKPEDLLTICYTSGTTGQPKGVMLTHDSMASVLEDCIRIFGKSLRDQGEVILSFLPSTHILGKMESMAGYAFGWKQAFTESLDQLPANLLEIKPTLVISVPRMFEKAYNTLQAQLQGESYGKRKLFDWAVEAGRRYYEPIRKGRKPGILDQARYLVADRLVFSQVRGGFGGRLRLSACGGAPLPREIAEFFQIAGIQVLEGYGLTETCAPVTFNTPSAQKLGTVGRPLPEVDLKIAEDGEILVHSRKVFKGYYKKPDETREILQDGWLRTGDIGQIDSQGYLSITDRKKDLIITSAGKNIAPQKIESLAKTFKMISQLVVLGDHRNFLIALVTLNPDEAIRYANDTDILFSQYSELIKNAKLIHHVQRIIDRINEKLASYETIKKFLILPKDFTVESGELTPSLKVRRNFVSRKYREELDSLYGTG